MNEYIMQEYEDMNGVGVYVTKGVLVRCRDCKHWYQDADSGMACEFTNMSQPEDGFCNWGERKDGDSE